MALKLQSLRLKNWKCYQNEQIEFNLDTEQHIWIVFGQNGFGKTSILEAIQWCIYGSDAVEPSVLLNNFNRINAKKTPNLELAVQLKFELKRNVYDISRTARRVERGTTASAVSEEATVLKNGINQADVRERIEEILPRSCKDFFFFDGVEIKRYAQRLHTKETLEAIERILGIPELRNLRDDAKRARSTLEKRLEDATSTNESLNRVRMELADIEENLQTKKSQLQIAKEEHDAAIDIMNDAKTFARQIEELRSKLTELNKLDRESSRKKDDVEAAEIEVEATLRQAPIPLLVEFVREVAEQMQSTTITTARRSGSVTQLRELLESDTCVCGRCIDESARQHILQELQSLENFGGSLTKDALLQDKLRNRLVALSHFRTPNFEQITLKRDRLREDLDEIQQAIYRLKKETQGVNEEEAQEIWQKVIKAGQDVTEKKDKSERLKNDLKTLEQLENERRREIENLAGRNKETANLALQVKLANGLYQAAEDLIEWRIAERKKTIEARTSEIHRRVTNKPDEYLGVEIQDDYTLGIKNAAGEILNPDTLSAGEKEALAFAFIAGLNLASGTAAPLIMDTPFGHLDTDHQKNLINALPEIPSQVIVLATDRDFPDRLLQAVRPYVAGIQKIKRLSVTEDASTVEVEE